MKIGFVGLGRLGLPLAANLARKGFDVTGYDLAPDGMARLVAEGGRRAGSIGEAAAGAGVLITVLPDVPDVLAAVLGDGGVLQSLEPGRLFIDMSTIDPVTTREIGARLGDAGIRMVDAPVTRSVDMAWEGKSALLVGGAPADVDEAGPLFDAMADLVTHCGPLGAGTAMKLTNNFLAHGIVTVVAEALGIGLKSGLTLETILEATSKSGTSNRIMLEVLPQRAFHGDFSPGFRCVLAHKDQRLACTLADSLGVETPLGDAVLALFGRMAEETPDLDFTAVLQRLESEAGFQARLADG